MYGIKFQPNEEGSARLVESYVYVADEELVEDDGDQELGGGDEN